jgi:hypothetical protein
MTYFFPERDPARVIQNMLVSGVYRGRHTLVEHVVETCTWNDQTSTLKAHHLIRHIKSPHTPKSFLWQDLGIGVRNNVYLALDQPAIENKTMTWNLVFIMRTGPN